MSIAEAITFRTLLTLLIAIPTFSLFTLFDWKPDLLKKRGNTMKQKNKRVYLANLLLIATLLECGLAEARNFYRAHFEFKASYTNIRTGSKKLFEDSVTVSYSDDAAFCIFQYGKQESPCHLLSFRNGKDIEAPLIDMSVDYLRGLFVSAASTTSGLNDWERAAVVRLIQKYPSEPIKLFYDKSYYYQLHDEQPEAIHVQLSGLSYGRKI